jgi:ankyrin repeat protein
MHRNRDNETALMRAVLGGHTEAAEELMKAPGIDVNAKTATGKTALSMRPLHIMSPLRSSALCTCSSIVPCRRQPDTVPLRVGPGVPHGTHALPSDPPPALWTVIAAGSGQAETASALLVDDDIDLNAQDQDGRTALIHACRVGDYDMALLLLINDGISIDAADKAGKTALDCAREGKHEDVADLLVIKLEERAAA